jgi:hypothetical protein
MADPSPRSEPPRRDLLCVGLLAALVALFLFPYLFLGRSLVPFDLVPLFQPWARHAAELWGRPPDVYNPLLDPLQQYYPRRVFMTEALHAGWLPLWNPYIYAGSNFLGLQQGVVLYPPAWLLTLVSPAAQFGWSAFLHLTAAATGGFVLLRQLGLRAPAAFTGGAAFALNGFMIVWLAFPNVTQWTMAWLPVALAVWERGRARDDPRWLAVAGGVLALAVLGGHGQSTAYVWMVWFVWAVFYAVRAPHPIRSIARWVVLPAGLGVLLSLGHLVPAFDYLVRSHRAGRLPWEQVELAAMPAAQFWTLLLPRLFGDETLRFGHAFWMPPGARADIPFVERSFYPGIAVLLLAITGLAGRRRLPAPHGALPWLCALMAALACLWGLATPFYWPLWRWAPGFGQFASIARVLWVAAWPLALLAALGVEAATTPAAAERRPALRALALGALALGLLTTIAFFIYGGAAPFEVMQQVVRLGRMPIDTRAALEFGLALLVLGLIAAVPFLASRVRGRGSDARLSVAGWVLAAVVTADLAWFGYGFNPAASPHWLTDRTPEIQTVLERQAAEGPTGFLSAGPPGQELNIRLRMPSNLPSVFGIEDAAGSESFVSRRYRQWEEALAQAAEGESPFSRFATPGLRAAGVRYYLTADPEPPGSLVRVVNGLYEDPQALPYARVHGRVERLGSEAEVLAAVSHPDRFPLIALAGPLGPGVDGPPTVTAWTAARENSNRLRLTGPPVPAEGGVLLICEQFDAGWRATSSGAARPVAPVDHLFLGVGLEPGASEVHLRFEPDTFRVGLFGSLIGLAVLLALFAGTRPRL